MKTKSTPSAPTRPRSTGEAIAAWLAARAKELDGIDGPVRRNLIVPATWVIIALIAITDYALGPEVSLRFFYCLPLVLIVAVKGSSPAVFMAWVCDFCWLTEDWFEGASYSSGLVPILKGLIMLSFYLLVIWILDGLLSLHREMEARVAERTAALTNEMAERNRLEREIINMSEKERWSLGHDLHDGLGQHFTATAMAAQALTRDLEDDRHRLAADGYRLVRMIEDGIGQTRRLAKGLLLVTIEEEELADALREMAASCERQFRVTCEVRTTGRIAVGDATVATHLFRIAQEAVRNAARHAKASSIELRLSGDDAGLLMTIRDNGIGLPPATSRGAGMGLQIMAHRAKAIGAEFDVRLAREGGTVVECRWSATSANSSPV